MQLIAQSRLREAGAEATVSTPHPAKDMELYGHATCRSRRRNLLLAVLQVLGALLYRGAEATFGRGPRILIGDDEGRAMLDADLVVDLSGDMMTEAHGSLLALSHLLPLFRARAIGTPYALVAQSIGPFRHLRRLARWILAGSAIITTRDPISARYLRERLAIEPTAELSDLAFLLQPEPYAVTETPDHGGYVTVSLSGLAANRYDRLHRPGAFVALVADVLDRLARDGGITPVFVAHVTGPTPALNDRLVSRDVADRMSARAVVIGDDLRPGQLKSVIGGARFHVGARMHSNIAALSQAVPTVALSYSHKTEGILEDLGLPELACSIDDLSPELLLDHCRALLDDGDGVRARLETALPEVLARSARNLAIVQRYVGLDAS